MIRRAGISLAALALAAAPAAVMAQSRPPEAQTPARVFDIPAGPLAAALDRFSRQSGKPVLYRSAEVETVRSDGARGSLSPDAALGAVLSGTGFEARRDRSGAVAIVRSAAPAEGGAQTSRLDDVVVTATKRSENVRQIAGSVTALNNAALEQIGADELDEYIGFVPGVTFNRQSSTVTIRGVSTTTGLDQGQGSTGYFINDVPLTDPYYSVGVPNIDGFDVESIAVLRGPQGTLFGSASLGGAINYKAATPKLDVLEFHGEAALESVHEGATGGTAKAALNLPVIDGRLAVRGTYVYREDAGYIDNLGTGTPDENRGVTQGGRFQALWSPAEGTTVSYLYLDQTQRSEGTSSDRPTLYGELANSTVVPNRSKFATRIHSLRLDQDLGFGTLTATATHHEKALAAVTDITAAYGAFVPGVSPLLATQDYGSKGETFEVRLVSKPGRFEYLVGVMYDRTRERFTDRYLGEGAAASIETAWADTFGPGIGAAAAPEDVFFTSDLPFVGTESAVFGEASYKLTPELKLTLGGRLFKTESETTSRSSGFFLLFSGDVLAQELDGSQSEDGFNPKVSLSWTPDDHLMTYATVSKGFRFGGPNVNAGLPGENIPPTFSSDSLINYEVGVRSTLLDGRWLLDASLFYIDWSDIQLRLGTPTGLAYETNAAGAENKGVEVSSVLFPFEGLSLRTAVTYLDASLTEGFEPGAGAPTVPSGTTLPGAAKWKVSNILSYDWTAAPLSPTLVLTHQYVSESYSDFVATGGTPQGDYSKFGARLELAIRPTLDLTLYADNIFDERGTSGGFVDAESFVRSIERPRTVGATLRFRGF
jgi:iron complex outermembrane receptor protein